jgi:DNA-binding GntR family transcriptional regulator
MVTAEPSASVHPVDRAVSLREQAYERIRSDIFEGVLEAGDALSEARLAKFYGISRTPVREAIKQLSEVGLVRLVPHRGAFVSEIAPHDVVEIYELREQLDGLATQVAAAALSDQELAELRDEAARALELMGEDKTREAFDLAVGTHKRITRAVRNGRLLRMLGQLEDESRRLSHLTFRSGGRLEAALREHQEIVEALCGRDAERAQAAMRAHLRADRDAALGQLRGGRVP